MEKIKAIIKWNDETNTQTRADFEIIDELPEVGTQFKNGLVVEVKEATVVEYTHDADADYDYYEIKLKDEEVDDEEDDWFKYFTERVAVAKAL